MRPYLIERLLSPLAPGLALRRARARLELEAMTRAYEAAKPSRATRNWHTTSSSAAAEDGLSLKALRNRSRAQVRDDPWGRKAIRILPAHMVGTGVVPRPDNGASDVTRRRSLSAWQGWAEATDVEGLGFEAQQHAVAKALVQDGEALVLWTPSSRAPGGFNTRVLEGDYLDETFHQMSRNGSGRIVNGVEFDAEGRRVAYHLWSEHPGDGIGLVAPLGKRIRVEARFVDHVFERMRPGQVRGVPWLAASMLGMRNLGDYLESERWRKKVASAFAGFFTTTSAPAESTLGQSVRTETDANGDRRALERISPGLLKRLRPGEDVKFSTPPSDQGLADYLRWELLAISAGIGVPYAELTGDLSNANYGSMRAGKIEFWVLLDCWQWLMLVPQLLRPAWRRVQAASGVPMLSTEWGFPKRAWVDPLKDVQAELVAIRGGLVSLPDAVASRGYDYRQVLREIAAANDQIDELGLILDSDPRRTAKNGAASDPAASADPAPAGDTTTN